MILVPVLCALAVQAQDSGTSLRALAQSADSGTLVSEVRRHPAAARELLGQLVIQAGRMRDSTAAVLQIAQRIATAYAVAWDDSFPASNVRWVAGLSPDQRALKATADSVRLAGNATLGRAGVAAAQRLWRQALRRYDALGDTAGMAAALGNIGAGFYRESRLDSAEAYLSTARRYAELIGDRRTAVNALGALGNVAIERDDLRGAREAYTLALALRQRIGDVRGAAADHTNLGLLALEVGNAAEARRHHLAALEIARHHALTEAEAIAQLNLGNVASALADYRDAGARYAESLRRFRELDNHADAALVLHNMGLLEMRRGAYRVARARLREALVLFARAGTTEDLVSVRRDLAAVEGATGQLRAAQEQLRAAERALEAGAGSRHDLAADILVVRADIATLLNTYAEADRLFARAQALYARSGDVLGESDARQGRAMLLVERAQYPQALAELDAILRLQGASDDRRPAAITHLLIGDVHDARADVASARRAYEESERLFRGLGDPVGRAAALVALADLDLQRDAPLAAEERARDALALLGDRPVPSLRWRAHSALGRARHLRGALPEAATALRAAIAEVERVSAKLPLAERRSSYMDDKWDAYAHLALLELARNDVPAAFDASERLRARQMLDLLSRGAVTRDPRASVDSALLAREGDLRRRIAELTDRLEAENGRVRALRGPRIAMLATGVTREALASAQAEYTQIRLQLREESDVGLAIRGTVSPWRAVAGRLAPGRALITYLLTDSASVAFVLTADTLRAVPLAASRRRIATLVDFTRGTLGAAGTARGRRQADAAWRAPLRRLHDHLLRPLEDAGALAGIRELVIVPHAELHYLPFAALIRAGEGGARRDSFLIERYDVAYAPSASTWTQLVGRGGQFSDRVLAIAPRGAALPGSLEEVDAIRALYGDRATVIAGRAATEEFFRDRAGDFGVVHLATYGVLNKHNPLFSFVELEAGGSDDGRLEVHEVLGLSLRARLLVLSACQTALASGAISDVPTGDDWVGLVRAFLGAGVSNVVATLWAVEDRSTAAVMRRFHESLSAGLALSAALSEAQRQTLRNAVTADPFYWAGFALVGGH